MTDTESARDAEALIVRRGERVVGRLERTDFGARFRYEPDVVAAPRDELAVCFRMPVREAPYESRGTNVHPFFAGLLPEGLRMRALVRGTKTSEDDLFSLLAACGADTVGDVRVHAPGEAPTVARPVIDLASVDSLSFDDVLRSSLTFGETFDRAMTSGVQPKVSAAMISMSVEASRRGKSYMLKLTPSDYPRLVENEFFWMRFAKGLGLQVAEVALLHDRDGAAGLLVERFDRVPGATRNAPRVAVHQEDACQLLDRYPADKYRLRLREIGEALDVCSAPIVERARLVQLVALSYAIGNGDLHGKNISVRVHGGDVRLSPLYDVLSTLPYGDDRMALGVEGRDKNVTRRDIVNFGERIGVREAATARFVDRLVPAVGAALERLGEIGLPPDLERRTRLGIAARLDDLAR